MPFLPPNQQRQSTEGISDVTVNSGESHVVSPEEEKERLQWEGFAEKVWNEKAWNERVSG